MQKVFGLIEFSEELSCAPDSLGKALDVSFDGVKGSFVMPALPAWGENEADPLHKLLVAPAPAKTWKRGEEPLFWGRPTSYPQGTARVELALLVFEFNSEELDSNAQKVYNSFGEWIGLFEDYVKLLTKQGTRRSSWGGEGPGRLELLYDKESKLERISRVSSPIINIELGSRSELLNFEQLRKAVSLSSRFLNPSLHYRVLLESYRARRNGDFRKAIIEAATALEICLTVRIQAEFKSQSISFGEKLLQKYRMLGGRFELVKVLEIEIPNKDYKTLVIEPRNDVIHRASFPDKRVANQVISEVEELLYKFTPHFSEDT